jgi:hypothetical protein
MLAVILNAAREPLLPSPVHIFEMTSTVDAKQRPSNVASNQSRLLLGMYQSGIKRVDSDRMLCLAERT